MSTKWGRDSAWLTEVCAGGPDGSPNRISNEFVMHWVEGKSGRKFSKLPKGFRGGTRRQAAGPDPASSALAFRPLHGMRAL